MYFLKCDSLVDWRAVLIFRLRVLICDVARALYEPMESILTLNEDVDIGEGGMLGGGMGGRGERARFILLFNSPVIAATALSTSKIDSME